MYAIARSRLRIPRNYWRCLSTALLQDRPPLAEPSAAAGAQNRSWNFLKYSLVAALTGGAATAGYATYAYSLNEVDEKTKALRTSANYTVGDPIIDRLDSKQCIRYIPSLVALVPR